MDLFLKRVSIWLQNFEKDFSFTNIYWQVSKVFSAVVHLFNGLFFLNPVDSRSSKEETMKWAHWDDADDNSFEIYQSIQRISILSIITHLTLVGKLALSQKNDQKSGYTKRSSFWLAE